MNDHLFYCCCFQIFYYFVYPKKIDIILADRLEIWTSIYAVETRESYPSNIDTVIIVAHDRIFKSMSTADKI